jgi:cyclophilin family peptidyl-prolyl cis-trans isomerase/HEAT repeat protein
MVCARGLGRGLVLLASLVLGACRGPDFDRGSASGLPMAMDEPSCARPSDGILTDPELQGVADLRIARDSAGLIAALAHPRAVVRGRAAFGLASLRARSAAPLLIEALQDRDALVRADAAFALGQLDALGGGEDALLALLAGEADGRVRACAIEALGKQGSVRSTSSLLAADGADLLAATLALARFAVRESRDLETFPIEVRDSLLARLVHPRREVRTRAAWFLSRRETAPLWVVRRSLVRAALARYPANEPAAGLVLKGLTNEFDILALPLVQYFATNSPDWRIRASAVSALARVGNSGPRTSVVLQALHDPAPLVRLAATQVLENEPSGPDFTRSAREILAGFPNDAFLAPSALRYLVRHRINQPVVEWAAELGLEDEDGWRVLRYGLAEYDGPEGADFLLRALSSSNAEVVDAAVRSVEDRWALVREFAFLHEEFAALVEQMLRRATELGLNGPTEVFDELLGMEPLSAFRTLPPLTPAGATVGARATPNQPLEAVVDWAFLASIGPRPRLVIELPQGVVTGELDTEQAPLAVQMLARLGERGAFDGVRFHRVIPNFVAQAGELPGATAGPGMRTEITRLPFGTDPAFGDHSVGMARSEAWDSETTQFFVTHSLQPHLDGEYGNIGHITSGLEVLDRVPPDARIVRLRVLSGH